MRLQDTPLSPKLWRQIQRITTYQSSYNLDRETWTVIGRLPKAQCSEKPGRAQSWGPSRLHEFYLQWLYGGLTMNIKGKSPQDSVSSRMGKGAIFKCPRVFCFWPALLWRTNYFTMAEETWGKGNTQLQSPLAILYYLKGWKEEKNLWNLCGVQSPGTQVL